MTTKKTDKKKMRVVLLIRVLTAAQISQPASHFETKTGEEQGDERETPFFAFASNLISLA
ncbi:hypothetical protein BDW_11230 [Bdellovibrio bacteriovorus W]|nr:hypothetical protein BDW_11230 [Bdellovibrio bacteriovorus W]